MNENYVALVGTYFMLNGIGSVMEIKLDPYPYIIVYSNKLGKELKIAVSVNTQVDEFDRPDDIPLPLHLEEVDAYAYYELRGDKNLFLIMKDQIPKGAVSVDRKLASDKFFNVTIKSKPLDQKTKTNS